MKNSISFKYCLAEGCTQMAVYGGDIWTDEPKLFGQFENGYVVASSDHCPLHQPPRDKQLLLFSD